MIDFFTGAGTGLVLSHMNFDGSIGKNITLVLGIIMILIGWYIKSKNDKKMIAYLEEEETIHTSNEIQQ